MAKKDKYHEQVKRALIKDGLTITHDPYKVKWGSPTFQVDLGAEKLLAAEKGTKKIAVEVKSFINPSFFTAFYEAVGKFSSYQEAIENREPDRELFVGVPRKIFDSYFEELVVKAVVKKSNMHLVIYDPEEEIIVQWKK